MTDSATIRFASDDLHFSATHFLVDMGKCERLHGHNYGVIVEITAPIDSNGVALDFNFVAPLITELIDRLDHKIILASDDSRVRVERGEEEIEARFGSKRFLFPRSDTVELPIAATTAERLASYFAQTLEAMIERAGKRIDRIMVEIVESPGRSARISRSVAPDSKL